MQRATREDCCERCAGTACWKAAPEVGVDSWLLGGKVDGVEDEDVENMVDDERHPDPHDEFEFEDMQGTIDQSDDGDELVLTRVDRHGRRPRLEMVRFDRVKKVLRIFPRRNAHGQLEPQFDQITELQLEARHWDAEAHSAEHKLYDLLHVRGLPSGFGSVYEWGLGIQRDYRGILDEIEERTTCSVVRFVDASPTEGAVEGPDADGRVFTISLQRFEQYRVAVDRSRRRGRDAVRRVIDANCHNAVADLFGLEMVEPKYSRNEVIRDLTEEVATGSVTNAADRALLVDELVRAAPAVAHEAPERFIQLREDIELVSLEVLIAQFEADLAGRYSKDEDHWQKFFYANQFALQQVFATPLVIARQKAHVRSADVDGRGSRIADFLCANTMTRTAMVVEIKTPGTTLMSSSAYREEARIRCTHRRPTSAAQSARFSHRWPA